jgi:hypothetical protein
MRRLLLSLILAAGLSPGAARAGGVDVALVLAVDVSFSTSSGPGARQREGYAAAFRSPAVHRAIQAGALGRVAVAYVEWAGAYDQRVVVRWSVIEDATGAAAFADRLERRGSRIGARTSLSGAIDFAAVLFDELPVAAERRVVDLSGDGVNNQGRPVTEARDEAVARGIVINGLPVMLPGGDVPLDGYFEACVVGGPGAFVLPVRRPEEFARAIETKLIREIADLAPAEPRVRPARAAPMSCEGQPAP